MDNGEDEFKEDTETGVEKGNVAAGKKKVK